MRCKCCMMCYSLLKPIIGDIVMNTNVIKINSDGCVEADNSHCSSCIYGYSIDKENKYYGCHISHGIRTFCTYKPKK
jgi:hypothetical protein